MTLSTDYFHRPLLSNANYYTAQLNKSYVIQWSKWLLRIKWKIYRKHKQAITRSIGHDYTIYISSWNRGQIEIYTPYFLVWEFPMCIFYNEIPFTGTIFMSIHPSGCWPLSYTAFEVDYQGNGLIAFERNDDRGPCVHGKSLISANVAK